MSRHLYDRDGSLYMGRWDIVLAGSRTSRVLAALTGYEEVRLHWIRRHDCDRDLHNHPFIYRTFVLWGWYEEERLGKPPRILTMGSTATGQEHSYHRIAAVPTDGVWTLFCMKKNSNVWGFLVDGVFVRSKDYFKIRQ